jgi:DNA-directed RNA polymerase III subunit RPC1
MRYDDSVRNSENTVIQFDYGDDSLSPEQMENNGRPVDFDRLHLSITQLFPCPEEPCLLHQRLIDKINKSIESDQFQCLLPKGKKFLAEIRSFFGGIADEQERILESCEEGQMQQRIWNSCRFTATQVEEFLKIALSKYTKAMVEPGESVGAIGAQSISEPGTQMTLKVSIECTCLCHG